eukprot:Nitzschia sp. Nitz4//scaffold393_size11853//9698//11425//NITZ4_009023-RA/size11853-processed-gene-0.12-mRNA-1//-1//CDS//3329550226//7855//frame0
MEKESSPSPPDVPDVASLPSQKSQEASSSSFSASASNRHERGRKKGKEGASRTRASRPGAVDSNESGSFHASMENAGNVPIGATRVRGFGSSVGTAVSSLTPAGSATVDTSSTPLTPLESVTATAVSRDDLEDEVRRQILSQSVVAQAVPVNATQGEQEKANSEPIIVERKRGSLFLLAMICSVILGGVIAGVLVLVLKDSESSDPSTVVGDNQPGTLPTNTPTAPPSSSDGSDPSSTLGLLLLLLSQHSPDIEQEGSPQSKALKWLVDQDYHPNDEFVVETYALLTFYFATDGDNWEQRDHWLNADTSLCDWYPGNLCEEPGQDSTNRQRRLEDKQDIIYTLELSDNSLRGSIPSEIFLLSGLEALYLDNNGGLTGTLPTELGLLTELETLDVHDTSLTGTIPTELGSLEKLRSVNMGDCSGMSGSVPLELWGASRMQTLILEGIGLTGSLPGKGKSAYYIFLAHNQLTGSLPSEVWKAARILDLSHNLLTGTIPSTLVDNWNDDLEALFLEGNEFSGDVPIAVCEMFEATVDALPLEDQDDYAFVMDCNGDDWVCECCTLCCMDGEDCDEPFS